LQNIVSFIGLFAKETYSFKEPTNRSHPRGGCHVLRGVAVCCTRTYCRLGNAFCGRRWEAGCPVLQCVAVCYRVVPCAAVWCIVLQCVVVCCIMLLIVDTACAGIVCICVFVCVCVCVRVSGSGFVLQCAAVCRSVLFQCVAKCSHGLCGHIVTNCDPALRGDEMVSSLAFSCGAVCCSVLQCVAVCSSVLQCVAVCC